MPGCCLEFADGCSVVCSRDAACKARDGIDDEEEEIEEIKKIEKRGENNTGTQAGQGRSAASPQGGAVGAASPGFCSV